MQHTLLPSTYCWTSNLGRHVLACNELNELFSLPWGRRSQDQPGPAHHVAAHSMCNRGGFFWLLSTMQAALPAKNGTRDGPQSMIRLQLVSSRFPFPQSPTSACVSGSNFSCPLCLYMVWGTSYSFHHWIGGWTGLASVLSFPPSPAGPVYIPHSCH